MRGVTAFPWAGHSQLSAGIDAASAAGEARAWVCGGPAAALLPRLHERSHAVPVRQCQEIAADPVRLYFRTRASGRRRASSHATMPVAPLLDQVAHPDRIYWSTIYLIRVWHRSQILNSSDAQNRAKKQKFRTK